MSSRLLTSLLVTVLVAMLVYLVTHRLFGFPLLLLPLFIAWDGRRR
ncbi:MAG TPA: hypothetical protein PKZ80_05125 [Thermoleophilia bacterium]|nr:hypothetical protein [Thermoleophilia bacterium]